MHVLLAPAVNLHRTPVGGRTFEYFSEDPELTAALGAATVRAVQAHGVAVTVKHFVANDTEVERNTVDVFVDERVLRELYLRPFEVAVREAGAWGVMTAYNRLRRRVLRGEHLPPRRHPAPRVGLRRVRRLRLGRRARHGPVRQRRTVDRDAGLRPACTAPHLETAVIDGRVDEAHGRRARAGPARADRTHRRRSIAPSTSPSARSTSRPTASLCREVAAAGMVLARNVDAALPLAGDRAPCVPGGHRPERRGHADHGWRQLVAAFPAAPVDPRSASVARVPDLVHEVGCFIDEHTPMPDRAQLIGTDGEPGLELRFVNGTDPEAEPVVVRRTTSTVHRFFFSLPDGVTLPCILQLRGAYVPSETGPHEVGAIVSGRPSVRVGDQQLHAGRGVAPAQRHVLRRGVGGAVGDGRHAAPASRSPSMSSSGCASRSAWCGSGSGHREATG